MQKLTLLEGGQYYHIYNRGINGQDIFVEERNYAYFLDLYARYIEPVADTFAYCLLRNHFHLLARIKELAQGAQYDPTQQFSNFFNSYAKAINKAYGRTGSLFQKRFGRILVTSTRYLMRLVHYIHFNPQKHGFVPDWREYPYSSYRALLSDKPTRLKRDEALGWFDGRVGLVAFHSSLTDEREIASLVADDDN